MADASLAELLASLVAVVTAEAAAPSAAFLSSSVTPLRSPSPSRIAKKGAAAGAELSSPAFSPAPGIRPALPSSPGGARGAPAAATHLLDDERHVAYNRLAFKFARALKALNGACAAFEGIVRLRIAATHERAKALQALGLHEAAVSDFTDVLGNSPSAVAAFFRRGLSLRAIRCYSAAADDLETARSVVPRDERFNVNYYALRDSDVAAVAESAAGEEPPGAVIGLDGDADVAVGRLYVGST